MEDVSVEQVPPGLTYALRQRVLRPHQTIPEMVASVGDRTGEIAFAALHNGAVVGSAIVLPAPCPWRPEVCDAWRLRAMATEPELRGAGLGRRVLDAAVDYVRTQHGTLLWCTARVRACEFYERAGCTVHGDVYPVEHIGPHVKMWRQL